MSLLVLTSVSLVQDRADIRSAKESLIPVYATGQSLL